MQTTKLNRITTVFLLTAGMVVLIHATARANETQDLKNQVQALQQKVDQLEKQLANRSSSQVNAQLPNAGSFYDQWDPFAQMQMMEHQMGHMMKENAVDFNPREDIKQMPHAYIVSMDIPGMQKDKINLEVKNGVLVVSGQRESEVKEQRPNQYYRQERYFGNFLRTVPLPDDAKTDNINAQYKDGVLTITVPRTKVGNKGSEGQKITIR